jgi:uncharacterized membrane protein YfcA
MSIHIITLLLIAALLTAILSGIFGMAGGLILMGVMANFLGVAEAMVVHGAVQGLSNSYRAFLLREHVRWDIFKRIIIGALPAITLLSLAAFIPSKGLLFVVLGALPLLLWVPKRIIHFDAQKPSHAYFCGFFITGLNFTAGAAGPSLDMFFVRTDMNRQEIVATKALTMFCSHLMKIAYFGIPLLRSANLSGLPPWWFFVLVIPFAMAGTYGGTRILKRMTDINFRIYTRWLVSFVGLIYIWRGVILMGWI